MAEKFLPPIFIPVFESTYPRYPLSEFLEKSENWKAPKIFLTKSENPPKNYPPFLVVKIFQIVSNFHDILRGTPRGYGSD